MLNTKIRLCVKRALLMLDCGACESELVSVRSGLSDAELVRFDTCLSRALRRRCRVSFLKRVLRGGKRA